MFHRDVGKLFIFVYNNISWTSRATPRGWRERDLRTENRFDSELLLLLGFDLHLTTKKSSSRGLLGSRNGPETIFTLVFYCYESEINAQVEEDLGKEKKFVNVKKQKV